jgi:hypothetical protein
LPKPNASQHRQVLLERCDDQAFKTEQLALDLKASLGVATEALARR